MKPIEIHGREIGPGEPCYVVAEMSANHGQDFERACDIVRAAADAGADAIKLQTYTADTLTIDCDAEPFRIGKGTLWEGRTLYDLYSEAYTPWEWQPKLMELAHDLGIHLFSSPFDATAVDFLEEMDVPAHKIASFEIVDIPLLQKVASTGKPVILSTGMSTLEEIEEAVQTLREGGTKELVLLKCTSAYPAPPEDANLRTIPHLSEKFSVPVGLSDHTMDIEVAIASVALGACMIEKHFTLSRDDGGPDSSFSLEPAELRELVDAVRKVEASLGSVLYGPTQREKASLVFRRSLFVVEDVKAGERFTEENVRSIRPGQGLPPRLLRDIVGKVASRDIVAGTALSLEVVAP